MNSYLKKSIATRAIASQGKQQVAGNSVLQQTIDKSGRLLILTQSLAAQTRTIQRETEEIGERIVTRATGVATKRKFKFFGKKQYSFATEDVTLPVYRELDREKRYYSATKAAHIDSIKANGFKTEYGGNGNGSVSAPQNVGQYNSRGHIYFFNNEMNARKYAQNNVDGDYAVIEFVLPEELTFTPDPESGFSKKKLSSTQALRTDIDIPADCIMNTVSYKRIRDI